MKRDELKNIIKECLNEIFEENDYFMRMVAESIRASVSATLKESLTTLPTVSGGESLQRPKKKTIETRGFNPAEYLNNGGLDAVKEIMNSKGELEAEKSAHQAYVKALDEKIPDEMIFGSDFKAKMQKFMKG